MSARQRMTMRATIERDAALVEDDYGHPGPPNWQMIGTDVPCFVWAGKTGGRKTTMGAQHTITMDMPGAIFSFGTDVGNKDRLRSVTDRRGKELFSMMYVDAVLKRKDHLGVGLRDYA